MISYSITQTLTVCIWIENHFLFWSERSNRNMQKRTLGYSNITSKKKMSKLWFKKRKLTHVTKILKISRQVSIHYTGASRSKYEPSASPKLYVETQFHENSRNDTYFAPINFSLFLPHLFKEPNFSYWILRLPKHQKRYLSCTNKFLLLPVPASSLARFSGSWKNISKPNSPTSKNRIHFSGLPS